jgi:hypothetical protein
MTTNSSTRPGKRARPARGKLLDAAAEVARRFRSFDEYGSIARAARALKRRQPGFPDQAYPAAVERAIALYDAALKLAGERVPALLAVGRTLTEDDLRPLAVELRGRAPGFPAATYRWMVGWVYYWWHLR